MNDSKSPSTKMQLQQLKTLILRLPAIEQKNYQGWLDKLARRYKQKLPIDQALAKAQKQIQNRLSLIDSRTNNLPVITFPELLPISKHVEELTTAINENQVIIVAGETGSGKTTQLPKICLAMGRGINGQIGHTQPRRLAAKTVAIRIADELNVELSKEVGYQVRFDDRSDPNGYIKLMTDGILLNELHHDPLLKKYDTLIIDEAHERSLNIDFILGILHQLLKRRADLKVIITSATIDPERFSKHFDHAPVIEVSGRTFPVETRYHPLVVDGADNDTILLEEAVYQAAETLILEGPGDILVFLPGEQDIRHIADYLRRQMDRSAEIMPLYSRLAQSEQMKIFSINKSSRPRIILSTNVAETSLTVPGIHYVIDSGSARISRYSVRSKVQRLPIEAISQASANQRQGRCGRIADGICIRLFSEEDFLSRSEFTDPEIKRTNLASVILQMAMLELGEVEDFNFLEPPEPIAINDGYKLLQELGAMDTSRKLTSLGKQLAVLPVDPKIGRILIAGAEMFALNEILIIAAAMSLPDPRERPIEKQQQADEMHRRFVDSDSDFLTIIKLWNYISKQKQSFSWNQLRKLCHKEFLNFNRIREWREIYGQLKRLMTEKNHQISSKEADYESIHKALLSGLVSQVGERTTEGDYQSTRQNRFYIFPGSGLFQKKNKQKLVADENLSNENLANEKVINQKWLLAGELVETKKLYARQVARINPAWVEDVAPHLLKQQYSEPYWSRKASRAMVKETMTLYGLIVIANRPKPLSIFDPELAHELFIHHAFVENDFATRAPSIIHNRKCLEQVEAMEHIARRRDILIEQDYLNDFYGSKIPNTINNGQAFEKWYKKSSDEAKLALQFTVDDLIRDEVEEIDRNAYPESLTINGISLELEYHFEPGAVDDGLHIILPMGYINQFQEDDFAWLVPGMLEAKLIALIKGLPKSLRKKFVPVPEYAKALKESLSHHYGKDVNGSFIEQMASQLKNMSGVIIDSSDFTDIILEDYLQPLYFLTDMESGNIIDSSRSLKQLQDEYAEQALDFLGNESEQALYDEFPSCGFEPVIQSKHGKLTIDLFSGMMIVDDAVAIKTFDNQQQAEENSQRSLKLLLLNDCAKTIKDMKRHLSEFSKAELVYATLQKPELPSSSHQYTHQSTKLYDDLFLLICDQEISNQACTINTPESFKQLKTSVLQALLPDIVEHSNLLVEIFRQSEIVRKLLTKINTPAQINLASRIKNRLDTLMYCGFISDAGWEQLHHYPRYLKALASRFERAELNPQIERERTAVWDKWWAKYENVMARFDSSNEKYKTILEFRSLLEEFHVSLFAQQLGTKKSVSEKKLTNILSTIID